MVRWFRGLTCVFAEVLGGSLVEIFWWGSVEGLGAERSRFVGCSGGWTLGLRQSGSVYGAYVEARLKFVVSWIWAACLKVMFVYCGSIVVGECLFVDLSR